MRHLAASLLLAALTCSTSACGDNPEEDTDTFVDEELIMNACGTFDPNEPGDSSIPEDPDSPEILAACGALCEAKAAVEDCPQDMEACVETCKMRACPICGTTLVPLVNCEVEAFDAESCTCGDQVLSCPTPEACTEENNATTMCGG